MSFKVEITDSFRQRHHLCNFPAVPGQCLLLGTYCQRACGWTPEVSALDALCFVEPGLLTRMLRSRSVYSYRCHKSSAMCGHMHGRTHMVVIGLVPNLPKQYSSAAGKIQGSWYFIVFLFYYFFYTCG